MSAPGSVPFSNHTTSLAAAESIRSTLGEKAGQIYGLLMDRANVHRGLTADEIEVTTKMRNQTLTARIRGLVLDGLAFDSGQVRPTRTGRDAIVWMGRDRAVPPANGGHKPQQAGQVAAAVKHERARVLLEFTKLAESIMENASRLQQGVESATIRGVPAYHVEHVKAEAIRKAVRVVGERLGK